MASPKIPKIKKLSLLVDLFGGKYKDEYANQNLELGIEETQIIDSIREGRYGKSFVIRKKRNKIACDMAGLIDKEKPDILHIACPTKNGELVFKKTERIAGPIDAETVLAFFNSEGASGIRLVVLRASGSKDLAEKIAEARNCAVLYMKREECPEKCREFLTAFYELLANGMTIIQSFQLAKYAASSRAFDMLGAGKVCFVEEFKPASFASIFASTPGKIEDSPLAGLPDELNIVEDILSDTVSDIRYPSSRREIIMKLAYFRPQIVQFSSHANYNMLCFYKAGGEAMELEKYWLINVMKEFKKTVHCVILNSCLNSPIAFRLSEHIDFVVGTNKKLGEHDASEFTRIFYSNLINQALPLDFSQAYQAAISSIENGNSKNLYRAYEKQQYRQEDKQLIDNKKMEAKELFLERHQDTTDQKLHQFRLRFEKWYEQFEKDPCMEKIITNFLSRFQYYSKSITEEAMVSLYQQLKDRNSLMELSIFSPVMNEPVGTNAVTDFWNLFCSINKIPGKIRIADITGHEKKLDSEKFCVVLIDGFSGDGQKCMDYISAHKDFLTGKAVYYLSIHSMTEGKNRIEKAAKEAGINLIQLSFRESKRAFQEYRVKPEEREHFKEACKTTGIQEKYILGKGNVEALCAFYNGTPQETVGIFWGRFLHNAENSEKQHTLVTVPGLF